jgi:translation initiation factor IF-1
MGEEAFRIDGKLIASLPNGTFIVQLSNGHELTGFFAGQEKKYSAGIDSGDKVRLQLTPYDLSVGRILVGTKDLRK